MLDSETCILFTNQLHSLEYKLQNSKNVFIAICLAPRILPDT